MADGYHSLDTQPIAKIGRVPIYATTILVAISLLGIIFTATNRSAAVALAFDPRSFLRDLHLWQIVTFPVINSLSFFNLVGLYLFYQSGVSVEIYLGRRLLFRVILVLLAVSVVASSLWWWIGGYVYLLGSAELPIGLFVAYASLYWISMRGFAIAIVVLACFFYYLDRNTPGISILVAMAFTAFACVSYERGHWTLPSLRLPRRKPKLRVLPKPVVAAARAIRREEPSEDFADEEVDALLDKIAKSGMASLTPAEKARLEKAREELLKKERR